MRSLAGDWQVVRRDRRAGGPGRSGRVAAAAAADTPTAPLSTPRPVPTTWLSPPPLHSPTRLGPPIRLRRIEAAGAALGYPLYSNYQLCPCYPLCPPLAPLFPLCPHYIRSAHLVLKFNSIMHAHYDNNELLIDKVQCTNCNICT